MPTYEYACTECGDRLEVVQSFSDAPLTTCPACQGKLRKLFSPVGVVFKGSGFYKTDSRNGKPKAASSPTAGSGKDAGSSGTTDKTAGTESSSDPAKPAATPSTSTSTSSESSASSESKRSSGASTGGGSKVA